MSALQSPAEPRPEVMDLVHVVQRLSLARDVATVQEIVRRAARRLTGADGATFVLRDGEQCHYVDEDAITPLWKGQRFPLSACVSGWAMLNREAAVIADIYADHRVPHDAYRPTFVKSMVMVPIRTLDPVGAIGNYWASPHQPTDAEVRLLQALADTTAVALENVRVFTELEQRVSERTAALEETNRQLKTANQELVAAHEQADRVFSALAHALPGSVLDGKYRLDEELGAGGFGVVFRGRHMQLDCPIAVKVFRPTPGNDSANALRRFLREGATAARLDHPNAVRVLDSGVSEGGVAFLVMELLRGRSLAKELAAGPLSLKRAATIAARVAHVLAAAHALGIVHRDIKPDNIFLHNTGSGEVVKVVDFGIAKFFAADQTAAESRISCTGAYILGTPSYLAPERMVFGADDGRSDVFSLGATLYEMVCGESPWSMRDVLRLASGAADERRPIPMEEFRRGVPAGLEAIVLRSLERDPDARLTAWELASALDSLTPRLSDEPARPVPRPATADDSRCISAQVWPGASGGRG